MRLKKKEGEPILKIEHAVKDFNGQSVLKDISFEVRCGEVVAIIGPSGSGKTTIMRCAALLTDMTDGNLQYDDLCVVKNGVYAKKSVQNRAKRRFGFVFQNFNLFPHYSVERNIIDAPICVKHVPRDKAIAKANALLDKMGLSGRGKAYPCELSGGQQQRVAIARALAMEPEILFFDEPTSALDPEMTLEVLKCIRQLAEENMTMVIVTHALDFAASVADRIVFIADGVIVEEGPAAELIANPQNERTRNFINGFKQGK